MNTIQNNISFPSSSQGISIGTSPLKSNLRDLAQAILILVSKIALLSSDNEKLPLPKACVLNIASWIYPITPDANSIDLEIIRDFFKNFRKKYGHFGLFKLGNGCTVLSIQDRVKDWLAKKPTPVSKILSEVVSLKNDEKNQNLTTSRAYLKKLDGLSEEDFTKWECEDKYVKKVILNQRIIDFQNKCIKLLPFELFARSQISCLNFEGCKVCYLPEEFRDLTNLHSLSLKDNELRSLPDSFGNLNKLRDLDLHGNRLRSLPANFGDLFSLKLLFLENNKLESLPDGFAGLNALTSLNLRANRLKSLPDGFNGLSSLTSLDLCWNELTSLPKNFKKMTSLGIITLHNNRFESLPEDIKTLKSRNSITCSFRPQRTEIETCGLLWKKSQKA